MKYLFIVNPKSGKNNKHPIEISLKKKVTSYYQISFTEYGGHAKILARNGIESGFTHIIAVGGDGTMNEVASELVNSSSTFGLIPTGSGNGFARSLNIPRSFDAALGVCLNTKKRLIDVGQIHDKYFFCVAGIGLDERIGRRFLKNKLRGPIPYFFQGFLEYLKYEYPSFLINDNDVKFLSTPLILSFANAPQFGNNAYIAPNAKMDDGELDLCILGRSSLFKLLIAFRKIFNKRIDESALYFTQRFTQIEVSSESEQINFHTDGEPNIGPSSIKITILQKALKILVP